MSELKRINSFDEFQVYVNKKLIQNQFYYTIDKIDFEDIEFYNITFPKYTVFQFCTFTRCTFKHCNLQFGTIKQCTINTSTFDNCDLFHFYIKHTNILNSNLNYCEFSYSTIELCDLANTVFYNIGYTATAIVACCCEHVQFYSCHGDEFLIGNSVAKVDFNDCNVTKADFAPMVCPEEGGFVAWKGLCNQKIAKLLIPEDAKRSSAYGRKCRASYAQVLQLYDYDIEEKTLIPCPQNEVGYSWFNNTTEYIAGQTIYPDSWDEDRWNECSHGIHFFITKQEAIDFIIGDY